MSGDSASLQKPQSYTSPTKPSKRRRLGNASHTLSQPFKSPFKTPLKNRIVSETHVTTTTSSPTKENAKTKAPLSPPFSPQSTPTITLLPPSQVRISPSPELLSLQKQHTRLLNQLSASRSHLETSNQALKIESSNRDIELEALIFKWRAASRAAAEEVFAGARDKVNKMGGMGAMRDRERQSKQKPWGWDDEPKRETTRQTRMTKRAKRIVTALESVKRRARSRMRGKKVRRRWTYMGRMMRVTPWI